MLNRRLLYLFFLSLIFFLKSNVLRAELAIGDTIPPVILSPALDWTVPCESSFQDSLIFWFSDAAGLTASDNDSVASIQSTIDPSQLIDTFNAVQVGNCINFGQLTLGFFPVDTCGNASIDTSYATFSVIDDDRPEITVPPTDITLSCDALISQNIQNWIDTIGGAEAVDACGGVTWREYIWADNQGNNGFALFSNQHEIPIHRDMCDWYIDVSFFASDDCENKRAAIARLSIVDTISPFFTETPIDSTVSCEDIPEVDSMIVFDYCDLTITYMPDEFTTQVTDSMSCEYSQYLLERVWDVEDACGNVLTHTQTLQVIDTVGPQISLDNSISLSCSVDPDQIDDLISVTDGCGSHVTITFEDETIDEDNCNPVISRLYTATDPCGNSSQAVQMINFIDFDPPVITSGPIDLALHCDIGTDYNQLISNWEADLGGSVLSDDCSDVVAFVAEIGSFLITDPNTYPGTPPIIEDNEICLEQALGVVYSEDVAFVFQDACGNVVQDFARITLSDTVPPTLINCQDSIEVLLEGSDCIADAKLALPTVMDNCLLSNRPTSEVVVKDVISDSGLEEEIVDTLDYAFVSIDQSRLAQQDLHLSIAMNNLDIDGIEEYFSIVIESDFVDFTKTIHNECGDTSYLVAILPYDDVIGWLSNDSIVVQLIPNIPLGVSSNGINPVCPGASIGLTLQWFVTESTSLELQYYLDGIGPTDVSHQDSLFLTLEEGEYDILFEAKDCGGNTATCQTVLSIIDNEPPQIICPGDTILYADIACSHEFTLNNNFVYSDNCISASKITVSNPASGPGFLEFEFDQSSESFISGNKQFQFVIPNASERVIENPQLRVEFSGNVTDSEIGILGENGEDLLTITSEDLESCGPSGSFIVPLEEDFFAAWLEDDAVVFLFEANNLPACGNVNEGFDNQSSLKLLLTYSDIQPTYIITGDTLISGMITDVIDPPSHTLDVGDYTITYEVSDETGNMASCEYQVSVIDTISPSVECKDTVVVLQLDGASLFDLSETLLLSNAIDNCGAYSFNASPSEIGCDATGSTISIQSIVTDQFGNSSSCFSNVSVITQAINPTFSLGLCQGDDLQFFANVPPGNDIQLLSFAWSGPNNFSSDLMNPVISSPGQVNSGTYQLIISGFNNCTSSAEFDVVVNQFQDPQISTESTGYCASEEVTLDATNFGTAVQYTWYEGVPPQGIILGITQTPSITLTPLDGEHHYYVVASSEDCVSNPSNEITVFISEQPEAIINTTFISVCEGEDIQFVAENGNATFDYVWTGPAGYIGSGPQPQIIENASTDNQGTYTLQVDDQGCLSDTVTVQVIVFTRPDAPIITGDNLLCEGANFSINAQNTGNVDSYTWLLDGVFFSNTVTNSLTIPNASSNLSGQWTCFVEQDLCESDISLPFMVTVESSLQVGVSNDGPVCTGDSLQLNATFIPDATYTWTSPGGVMYQGQRPKVIAEAGEYVLSIITNAGCSIQESTLVEINIPPVITALSNTAPSCEGEGQSIVFTPTVFPPGDYDYIWSGPNDFESSVENPEILNAQLSDNGVYTLQVGIGSCISDPTTTEVNINDTPFQPVINTIMNTCEGEILQLESNIPSDGSTSYTWQTPNGIFQTSNNLFFSANVGENNTGVYTVLVEQNGCSSIASLPVFIEITEAPQTPQLSIPSFVCSGETVVLEVLQPEVGVTYSWTGPSGDEFEGVTWIIQDVNTSDLGAYTVVASRATCSNGELASKTLFVISSPVPPQLQSTDTLVCSTALTSFEWCIEENQVFLFDSLIVENASTNERLELMTTPCVDLDLSQLAQPIFLGLRGYIQGCESELSNIYTIGIVEPEGEGVLFVDDSILFCDDLGQNAELIFDTNTDSISIQTNASNSVVTVDSITQSLQLSSVESGSIIIIDSYDAVCGLLGSDTLSVFVEEEVQLQADLYTMDVGAVLTIEPQENDNIPSSEFTMTIDEGQFVESQLESTIITLSSGLDYIGQDVLTYAVCSDHCPQNCDEAVITITIGNAEDCFVSNLVTPNNDGYNDTFRIPCLSDNNYPEHELIIFNRWGDEVYSAAPYANDWMALYNGEPLPSGTYYYILNLNNGEEANTGFITVER